MCFLICLRQILLAAWFVQNKQTTEPSQILTIPQYILLFMTLHKFCLNDWLWRVGSGWLGVGTYRYSRTDPSVWHAHHETWSGTHRCIPRTSYLGGLPRRSALDVLVPLMLRHNWLYRPSVEKEHRCFLGTGF